MISNNINLVSIFLTDGFGVLLILVLLFNQFWKIRHNSEDKIVLLSLMAFIFLCCLLDPIGFYCDGREGGFCRFMVYFVNYFLYFSNLVVGPLFVIVTCKHTSGIVSKFQRIFLIASASIGFAFLIVNFVTPIVFDVDANNYYERKPFYFVYMALEAIYLIDATVLFVRAKLTGGVLKYFPYFEFTIPVVIGIIIQTLIYGVSTIWPCVAIGICAFMSAYQSELIFTDKLTNCYSRFYLDNLKKKIVHIKKTNFTAMMLDLNGFKNINDEFGHSVGDKALIETAKILKEEVGKLGSVIRYAGDEFVILLNTQDDDTVNGVITGIKKHLELFNITSGEPYKLSISIGHCKMNLNEQSVDELMNEIDRLMYIDKNNYYKLNDRRVR